MRISNREVQVTDQFFVDDLQNDLYIDAMQSLVELYEYAKQGATIPNESWIIENLPTHKTGIMKRILRYIKTFNQDEVTR